jgi:hypothetical protein
LSLAFLEIPSGFQLLQVLLGVFSLLLKKDWRCLDEGENSTLKQRAQEREISRLGCDAIERGGYATHEDSVTPRGSERAIEQQNAKRLKPPSKWGKSEETKLCQGRRTVCAIILVEAHHNPWGTVCFPMPACSGG